MKPRQVEAKELFEVFTGRDAAQRVRVDIPGVDRLPSNVAFLGRAVAIEYEIAKDHDDGEEAIYRHEFTPSSEAMLLGVPGGRVLLLVGKFDVVEEGITDADQLLELGY